MSGMNVAQRIVCVIGAAAVVCVLSLTLSGRLRDDGRAVFAAAGGASIGDVMVVAHSGKGSLLTELRDAVKGSGPSTDKEWKAVKARGAVLASLATDVMGKQSPRKGSAASWKKQVAAYADKAKKLAAAAAKKDHSASNAAVNALRKSCKPCHQPHK